MIWYIIWKLPAATVKLIDEYRAYCSRESIEIAASQLGQLDKLVKLMQGLSVWEGSFFTGLVARFGVFASGTSASKCLFLVELATLGWLLWKLYKSLFVSGAARIVKAWRLPPHIYGPKYFAEYRKQELLNDAIEFIKASEEFKASCNRIAKKALPKKEYKKYQKELDNRYKELIDDIAQKRYGSDFLRVSLRQLKIQRKNQKRKLKRERKLVERNPRGNDSLTEILYYKCHQMFQLIWGQEIEEHVNFETGKEFDREQEIADLAMNEVTKGILEDLIERFRISSSLSQEDLGWSKSGVKFAKKYASWEKQVADGQMQIETWQKKIEVWESNPLEKAKHKNDIKRYKKKIQKTVKKINKCAKKVKNINNIRLKDAQAYRKSENDFKKQTDRLLRTYRRKSKRRNRRKNIAQSKISISKKAGYSIFKSFADYLRGNIFGCVATALGLIVTTGIMGGMGRFGGFDFNLFKVFFTNANGWLLFILIAVGIIFYFLLGALAGNVLEIEREDKDDYYRNLSIIKNEEDQQHIYFEEIGRIRKNTAKRHSALKRIPREYGITLFIFRNIFQLIFTSISTVLLLLVFNTESFNLVPEIKAIIGNAPILGKIIPCVKWIFLGVATICLARALWYVFSRNEFKTITMREDCRKKAKIWYRLMMGLVAFTVLVCLLLFVVNSLLSWGILAATKGLYVVLIFLVLVALIGMATDIVFNPRDPDQDVGVDFFSDDGSKRDPDDGPYVAK